MAAQIRHFIDYDDVVSYSQASWRMEAFLLLY